EDGCLQGLLNILEIPYTHSGMLASALAMDKPEAKKLFAAAGIPVAEHVVASRDEVIAGDVMDRPYVVKPLNEGSSVGVHIVRDGGNMEMFSDSGWPFGGRVMVEKFIAGRELTVAVKGGEALGVTEITTERGFYDYDAKYADGGSKHVVPAEIDKEVYAEAMRLSVLAHEALGCRGVTRADLRYDGDALYMLEINTQPGMTTTSLVPEQAATAGIDFNELVAWMVENAEYDG
ncbi:MAG TPA: D-alanine--D-alanine ligase, partial [Alphaproteobacteria bacterium]|nr:D-alanine--D-alanine ligase [Alphaproteobacteria bacterium]